jgi:hypothetical protein
MEKKKRKKNNFDLGYWVCSLKYVIVVWGDTEKFSYVLFLNHPLHEKRNA